jgi:hypothetical protein
MMQNFPISEALRCVLLNTPKGPNLACPRNGPSGASLLKNTSFLKEALAQRRDRVTLARWEGSQFRGLVSAHARRGYRVWEVDRFYISGDPPKSGANGSWAIDTAALELLEGVIEAVGTRYAERIFLRLPSESPIVLLARRAGFFPYFEELLLQRRESRLGSDGAPAPAGLTERLPQDDYPLFQLFSAATPPAVRAAMGLTFDQWRDAHEPRSRGRQEWVVSRDGRITGWLGHPRGRRAKETEVLVHPDSSDLWRGLVEMTLAHRGLQRWLVPDYQTLAADILLGHGFYETARFTMLIKTVAVPVMSLGMAPVEA